MQQYKTIKNTKTQSPSIFGKPRTTIPKLHTIKVLNKGHHVGWDIKVNDFCCVCLVPLLEEPKLILAV